MGLISESVRLLPAVWRNDLVYPEVGSCFARPAGDESERAVSFFEKAGTVDADCCYHVRKRGSFLLV